MDEGYLFRVGPVIKEYSSLFTNIKNSSQESGDMAMRNTAKLCINAGFGRFGSRYHRETTSVVNKEGVDLLEKLHEVNNVLDLGNDIYIVSHKVITHRDADVSKDIIKGVVKIETMAMSGETVNIALAAAITSLGRLKLYSLYE